MIQNINDYSGMWANGVNIGEMWDKIKEKFLSGSHSQASIITDPDAFAAFQTMCRLNIGLPRSASGSANWVTDLWVGRAQCDEDGNNIKSTYATIATIEALDYADSGTHTNKYVSLVTQSDGLINVTHTDFATPQLSFTGGTTAGPTLKVKTDAAAWSTEQTIPSASKVASGVVVVGSQEFTGDKSVYGDIQALEGGVAAEGIADLSIYGSTGGGTVKGVKYGSGDDIHYPDDSGVVTLSNSPALIGWDSTYQYVSAQQKGYLDAIIAIVPAAAYSSGNELADKAFVNSSIATATATFRGTNTTATTESDFLTWANALTHDLNDYVFWKTTDSVGNTIYKRYKYDGTQWSFEYDLNNSSFTAAQWSAINSGITSSLVTKLGGIETGAQVNIIETIKVNGTALTPSSKAVDITVPTALSQLSDDSTHRLVTDTQIANWTGAYDAVPVLTSAIGEVSALASDNKEALLGLDDRLTDVEGCFDSGSAKKALQLTNTRTIWGQNFNGTAGVSGDMSGVGNITFSASGKKIGGIIYFDTANNRIGINNTSPTEALTVTGDISASAGVSAKGITDLNAYSGGGGSLSGSILRDWSNYTGAEDEILGSNLGIEAFQMSGAAFQFKRGGSFETAFTLSDTNIPSLPLSKISDAPDLQAIEALTGTSGLLKKTAANTWALDTNTYVTTSGNAASATKLQVARKIWGQDFDGTADIAMTTIGTMKYLLFRNKNDDGNAGYIGRGDSSNDIQLTAYQGNKLQLGANGSDGVITITTGLNVGIGVAGPSEKLEVNGKVKATQLISTIAQGTAPLSVTSNTMVQNLNADLLDGHEGSYYAAAATTIQGYGITDAKMNIGYTGTNNDTEWFLITLCDKQFYVRFKVNTGAFELEFASDNTANPDYHKSFAFDTLTTAAINAICV